MVGVGRLIAKHKKLIIALYLLLLIPSVIGYVNTRINYDVLSYLPNSLETVAGQDIMVDEFGMGAFSMVVVEDMQYKDVVKLKTTIEGIEHVKSVLWYDDMVDISTPNELLPDDLKTALFNGDATMMVVLFDNTTSADDTMTAVTNMRETVGDQCFISGMSGIVTDIKNLSIKEMPIYVVIAACLSMIVLCIAMDSFFVPVLFLGSIGAAIVYNLGSNIVIGEISYITQALAAVLQLGVTMDYSIFLLDSYTENKKEFHGNKTEAMAHAIARTFSSVAGSSVTTLAGFAALMLMTFALGRNIGIVMMKGVAIGVICCVTLLPALILNFERLIDKTSHKPYIPEMKKISHFITKHYLINIIVFAVILFPAIYGNNHVELYYNIDSSLPETLDSAIANKKLEKNFNMNSVYMIMLKNGLSAKDKEGMLDKIEAVEGVKWAIGVDSFLGPAIPMDLVPADVMEDLKSDDYEIQFVCSEYKTATDEVNNQIREVDGIVKSYSPDSLVIGEAPLTKDLSDVTDIDLTRVNIASIAAIFLIIMILFKSVSLPVILVSVIEFAICVNMAIPYYAGTPLPFVASIVIGTIQLGATVDYAILMTGKYCKNRQSGMGRRESVVLAHQGSMKPIIISGCSFFAATFGVGLYSAIDMISAITVLLSRGAVISTIVVLTMLPSLLFICDPIICRTSLGFPKGKYHENEKG
ncbi:MAG: MMPL family transporter [Lachnospiraceae bacterium]|nr:MMPL family transporter [Lachnospiraceae bacterium]